MIDKSMTIEEVIRRYPQTVPVFREFGLECMECPIAAFEEVEHGASVHQVDIDALMRALNRAIA
ncbi:MAG TPA: DUF1858 domain-containing protein [Candidatus Krumholzibacterium sp.]|nr:DUF1858 domain-containing protein [Candidatus Krumholzibacterium sp.]